MINDLPLEDLAHGMFPDGVRDDNGKFLSQEEVIEDIRSFRESRTPILNAAVFVQSGPAGGYATVVIGDKDHEYMVSYSGRHYEKSFKLKLPKWIRFKTFYDALDFDGASLEYLHLFIRSREPPIAMVQLVRASDGIGKEHPKLVIDTAYR